MRGVPEGILAHGPEKGGSRGRPGHLTRETIVREALRIPAEEFSLGRLAESLGVSPQSLYHYFPSKESIASAMAEEVNRTVPVTSRDLPWRDYLGSVLRGYRAFLRSNDYAFARGLPVDGLSFFRIAGKPSPAMLERLNGFMYVFREAGLNADEAIEVWVLFQNFLRRSDLHRASQEALRKGWDELQKDLEGIDGELLRELAPLRGKECPSMDDLYESIVEGIIEGIAARYKLK